MNKKRKMGLGIFLVLSIVVVIGVANIAPAFVAVARRNNSLTTYAYGGQVTVQLPDGVPSHPTTLLIAALHIFKRGDYPMHGPHNIFAVYIWVPALNSFLPALAISTNQNPEHQDLIKEIYTGTPLWNPPLGMENCFWIDEEKLVTRKRSDLFFANLTEGVHVSLDFTSSPIPVMSALGDLSFDLPPIAFEIRGLDGTYRGEGEMTLPSGWSSSTTWVRKPAWVRLWIQEWTGGASAFKFAGELGIYIKTTMNRPPAT